LGNAALDRRGAACQYGRALQIGLARHRPNLGIKTFLNGALVSDIVLDTSEAPTDTIDYVATDPTGLTATSTRTVIVDAAPVPPPSVVTSTPEAIASSTSPAAVSSTVQ
jgi:hypothetical protein